MVSIPRITTLISLSNILAEFGAVTLSGPFTKDNLFDIAARLGPVERSPYSYVTKEHPWICPLSNRGKGHTNENVLHWHYDGSCLRQRSRYTLLYAEKAGKDCVLMLASTKNPPLDLLAKLPPLALLDTGVTRPFWVPHPNTGEPVLQVNTGRTLKSDVSELSAWLDSRAESYCYQDTELLILDNFSFLHKPVLATDNSLERLVYCITTAHQDGEVPLERIVATRGS